MNRWALIIVLSCLATGCRSRVLWEYRDDPYLQEYARLGEQACLQKLRSVYTDDRQVALRALAEMAAQARRQGDRQRADRLVEIILDRFQDNKDPDIRNCIVSACAPVCGVGSDNVDRFLRRRIAEGTWSHAAVLSLAALAPRDGFDLIAPLAGHPDPETRYTAALALTILRDPRGAAIVRRIVSEMVRPGWPGRIRGTPLALARKSLGARAERFWGQDKRSPAEPAGVVPGIFDP